jgi:hypothetical protein
MALLVTNDKCYMVLQIHTNKKMTNQPAVVVPPAIPALREAEEERPQA